MEGPQTSYDGEQDFAVTSAPGSKTLSQKKQARLGPAINLTKKNIVCNGSAEVHPRVGYQGISLLPMPSVHVLPSGMLSYLWAFFPIASS